MSELTPEVKVLVVVVTENWVAVIVVTALMAWVYVLYTVVLDIEVEATFVVSSSSDVAVLVTVIYGKM